MVSEKNFRNNIFFYVESYYTTGGLSSGAQLHRVR
jgi:hypothetical protein